MNGDEFRNENEFNEENSSTGNDGQYHYNYQELNQHTRQEQRWQPNSEKYNTYETRTEQKAPAPKKKKWWIPLAIVLGVLAVVAVAGTVIGVNAVKNYLQKNTSDEAAVIESQDNTSAYDPIESIQSNISIQEDSSSAGFYLTDVSDVVKEVMPSVVAITSRSLVSTGNYGGFWGYYFGNQGQGSTQEVESGAGSGTIVGQNDTELMILTSYHVVEGSSSFYITFVDGENVEGYLKAASEENDIAIVAVKLSDIKSSTINSLKIAKLSTDDVEVGDGVIVIGNALGYGQSVTSGIISAESRTITADGKTLNVMQTDAAINGGNSGGSMLNAKGEIIGISEAKVTSTNVEGVCYAIPIKENYDLIMGLMATESKNTGEESGSDEEETTRAGAYIGVQGMDISAEVAQQYGLQQGVYVVAVVENGGAEAAGVSEGDIIIGIDGKTITSMSELQSYLSGINPGTAVNLTILKNTGNNYIQGTVSVVTTGALQ